MNLSDSSFRQARAEVVSEISPDSPLYASDTKYDSGTGWPSFHSALPDAIGTREDRRYIFQVHTEVHCRRCGSHLGHVFDDGPEPTGKRHCLNGLALVFRQA